MTEIEHLSRIRISDAHKLPQRAIVALYAALGDEATMAEVAQMPADEIRSLHGIGPAVYKQVLASLRFCVEHGSGRRSALEAAMEEVKND